MSDLQTPWHRVILLKKKLGKYLELAEKNKTIKNKISKNNWLPKKENKNDKR